MSVTIPQIKQIILDDDGIFPNNKKLPLVIYEKAFKLPEENAAPVIEKVFRQHGWGESWRDGIYPFHHYHSTAHEVLGVYAGSARVHFGGEEGPVVSVTKGDAVVIPAGVAHKNHWCSHDFRVVGAYPEGQTWDMNYGESHERIRADKNIARVILPEMDPILGMSGGLMEIWH